MWTSIHTRLQEVCIDLWPVPEDCRNLVSEAGVDSSRMTFGEPPALRWESVIMQCDRQRSLDKLVPVLLDRYPRNPQLQAAVAPWIHGNPKEQEAKSSKSKVAKGKNGAVLEISDEEGTVMLEAPTTIVVTTPKDLLESEMVPVQVPKELAEEATKALVATIHSLRKTIAQHDKDLQGLKSWRLALSTLSRAEVAVTTGANEKDKE